MEKWNVIQNEKLNSKETKENLWIEVITDRHKRTKWLEINRCKQQTESINCYNLLYNLKETTELEQSIGFERKRVLNEKKRGVLVMKKHIFILLGAKACKQMFSTTSKKPRKLV